MSNVVWLIEYVGSPGQFVSGVWSTEASARRWVDRSAIGKCRVVAYVPRAEAPVKKKTRRASK